MPNSQGAGDVVVAGAGMAGLVAGATASERGVDVVVLEKGAEPGGSMRLSGGGIWTYETPAAAAEAAPRGDPELQAAVVDGLADGLDWLADVGVELEALPKSGDGWGRTADPAQLTAALVDRIEVTGGSIVTNAPLAGLVTGSEGIEGVTIGARSRRDRIEAEAAVLATGGFQGDPERIERYVTDRTDRLWLRGNPDSTGDGLTAAREIGAKLSRGFGWFYGHNMAAPPAGVSPDSFVELTQYYGPRAMAVDTDGERFTDEAACIDESELCVATARRADGRAYYIIDDGLYRSHLSVTLHVGTIVDRVADSGGRVARAATQDAIPSAVADWPLDGAAVRDTLRAFNAACRGERSITPPVSRKTPLDEPPYRVIAVQPGVTMTTGGLAVDAAMRVRSRPESGSSLPRAEPPEETERSVPIPGLYAAGTTVGNVHNGGYIGGLATALVTGRIAGRAAAE